MSFASAIFGTRKQTLVTFACAIGLVVIASHLHSNVVPPQYRISRHTLGLETTQCATPWKPVLPVDSPLSISSSHCKYIQSTDSKFSLQVCSEPQTCNAFTVKISRVDKTLCARMEERSNMTDDAEVMRYIKEDLGPDSFLLRTSGSQRYASEMPKYDGNCDYHFDVSLSNGGEIWLELWHNYEDYNAMDEKQITDFPPLLHNQLLPKPLGLAICSPSCPTYYSPRLDTTANPDTFFTTAGHHDSLVYDPSHYPSCADEIDMQGIYLPWHPMDRANPPAPLIATRTTYNYTTLGNYNFLPGNCSLKHAGNQFVTDHSPCTEKKNWVGFMGDSHQRFLLHSWQYRLAGHTDFYPEKQKDVVGRSNTTYDQSTVSFLWGPWANEFTWHPPEEYAPLQGLVMSHSAWSAQYGKPIESILAEFQTGLDYVDKHATSLKDKIFMTPAPLPPQKHYYRTERRTNVQLGYFNMRFKAYMKERGWKILDQYTIGMPMMLEMLSADGLHLSPGEAHASLVDYVLAAMRVCPT